MITSIDLPEDLCKFLDSFLAPDPPEFPFASAKVVVGKLSPSDKEKLESWQKEKEVYDWNLRRGKFLRSRSAVLRYLLEVQLSKEGVS